MNAGSLNEYASALLLCYTPPFKISRDFFLFSLKTFFLIVQLGIISEKGDMSPPPPLLFAPFIPLYRTDKVREAAKRLFLNGRTLRSGSPPLLHGTLFCGFQLKRTKKLVYISWFLSTVSMFKIFFLQNFL